MLEEKEENKEQSFIIKETIHKSALQQLEQEYLKKLTKEELQIELNKMLAAPIEQDDFRLFLKVFEHILKEIVKNPKEIVAKNNEIKIFDIFDQLNEKNKLAFILYNFCKDLEQAEEVLRNLKYSNEVFNNTMWLLTHYENIPQTAIDLKRLICIYNFNFVEDLLYLQHYTYPKDEEILTRIKQFYIIRDEEQVVFLNQLKVNGDDLIFELNIKTEEKIDKIFSELLEGVITGVIANSKEELLKYSLYLIKNGRC